MAIGAVLSIRVNLNGTGLRYSRWEDGKFTILGWFYVDWKNGHLLQAAGFNWVGEWDLSKLDADGKRLQV